VVDDGKNSKKPSKQSVDKVGKHVKDDKGKKPEIPLKKECQKKTYITNDQGNLRNKILLIMEPVDSNKTSTSSHYALHNVNDEIPYNDLSSKSFQKGDFWFAKVDSVAGVKPKI